MRQDQYERLLVLEEKLAEQSLIAADPSAWTGDGLRPDQMSKETRGNRHWDIKLAAGTLALTMRVGSLIGQVRAATAASEEPAAGAPVALGEDDLDTELANAEMEAERLIKRASGSEAHAEFVKRAVKSGK